MNLICLVSQMVFQMLVDYSSNENGVYTDGVSFVSVLVILFHFYINFFCIFCQFFFLMSFFVLIFSHIPFSVEFSRIHFSRIFFIFSSVFVQIPFSRKFFLQIIFRSQSYSFFFKFLSNSIPLFSDFSQILFLIFFCQFSSIVC